MEKDNLHNDDENLKQEAPFLFGLKKEEPFAAPDGYFEKFQSHLADKIHAPKKSSFFDWILKPVVWAPAMVLLITGSIFLFRGENTNENQLQPTAKTEFNLNEVSFEILDAYVSDHLLAEANTDEILEITGIENISLGTSSEISESGEKETPVLKDVEEEEMEEYIMENMEDMSIEY